MLCKALARGYYYFTDEQWTGAKALGDTEDCTADGGAASHLNSSIFVVYHR
jgi:hypothetical protein